MIYPYTVIEPKDIDIVFKILMSFGYIPSFNVRRFKQNIVSPLTYVVINDYGAFGHFCFYDGNRLAQNINRTYEQDMYKFLRLAAKYKNQDEY